MIQQHWCGIVVACFVFLFQFDMLLATLTNCVSRDLIDKFSVDFVHFNSKLNRMKLVQAMYQGQRASNDMLPYFGRLTATLEAAMKGFSGPLLEVCSLSALFFVSSQHM